MNPLVTLAVATLNRPAYLRETLSCVLQQDYPNLDIVVSDNGSRDETPILAEALTKDDSRVRFRRNRATVPIHEHFSQCLRAARGDYFILLCDDDRINPQFVSALVAVATRHPNVNVVVPANSTIDEQGEVIEIFAQPDAEVLDGYKFVSHWLYGRTPRLFINVVTVLLRTKTASFFGGYQAFAGGRNVDNLLFLQCAITSRVGFAKDAMFSWRVYNRSYGAAATPRQVTECSRQFLQHLLTDLPTLKVLRALPWNRRKQIIHGVSTMTANELFYSINPTQNHFGWNWKSLRKTFGFRRDVVFCLVVLRQYYYRLRRLIRPIVRRARS